MAYIIGDSDERNWGKYIVTAVKYDGDQCIECEKDITVNPGHMLSVQSHDNRSEVWEVISGTLTVVLNGKELALEKGETINIETGDIHTMANLGSEPCVVHEVQKGICEESDIHRYWDPNGREVEKSEAENVLRSIETCSKIEERKSK